MIILAADIGGTRARLLFGERPSQAEPGGVRGLLERIPLQVVLDEFLGLHGAARVAARYARDLES